MDIKSMLDEIKARKKLTKNRVVVGELDEKVMEFLNSRGIPIYTKEIYLNHKGLSHLARDSKQKRGAGLSEEDILKIPDIVKKPSMILFDSEKGKLNLLYCKEKSGCSKIIKLVIDTKYKRKKEALTLIKTAGYVEISNLKIYEKIYGDVESR
jgi:hypothetical protein